MREAFCITSARFAAESYRAGEAPPCRISLPPAYAKMVGIEFPRARRVRWMIYYPQNRRNALQITYSLAGLRH